VTFAEWDACVAGGGCNLYRPEDAGWGRDRMPVINVSWDDARAYVRWLTARSGRTYRLATEAEWEYAARAGSADAYSLGPVLLRTQATFGRVASRSTQRVATYAPNAFGLFDVHGNVREWVEDCYVASYAGAPADAATPVTRGDCAQRVTRGGSWASFESGVRSAQRDAEPSNRRSARIGFRVVRVLE
jgi:formylglycine-generating enzyme required for sulfatase activity